MGVGEYYNMHRTNLLFMHTGSYSLTFIFNGKLQSVKSHKCKLLTCLRILFWNLANVPTLTIFIPPADMNRPSSLQAGGRYAVRVSSVGVPRVHPHQRPQPVHMRCMPHPQTNLDQGGIQLSDQDSRSCLTKATQCGGYLQV